MVEVKVTICPPARCLGYTGIDLAEEWGWHLSPSEEVDIGWKAQGYREARRRGIKLKEDNNGKNV